MTTEILDKYCFNSDGWVSGISDFASAEIYDFVEFNVTSLRRDDVTNVAIVTSLIHYFDAKHAELNTL
jgi:hypothetical protein